VDWSAIGPAMGNLVLGMAWRKKTRPENVTRHQARARILDALHDEPGKNLARICDELDLRRQAASYHLHILERAGVIQSLERPYTTHFFPSHLRPDDQQGLATLRRERSLEVVHAVRKRPGLRQHELLDLIGMDRKVWRAYRRELTREGLLEEERMGQARRYRATARLERLLDLMRQPGGPS